MTTILIFFAGHWFLSLFTQSFFHHRYAAHGQFKMSEKMEKFWYVVSLVFQGSSYLSPFAYAILHRLHHAETDSANDPHSPYYDKNILQMMRKTARIYSTIFNSRGLYWRFLFGKVDEKYRNNIPIWHKFDDFASSWFVRIFFALCYISFYIYFDSPWYLYFLLPIHFLMGPIHGAIINWYAHKYGYRNFNTNDKSRNLMGFDVIMMGEGNHNNHHHNSSSPNFAKKWWEFDPTYVMILLLNSIGLIKLKKTKNP